MKRIIVTGCNGQLGRAVNQQYAGSTEYELVNTDVGAVSYTHLDVYKRQLHKQSEEQLRALGAVNEHGAVDLDTGAIMLDCDLLESLFSLIGEKGKMCIRDRSGTV